MTYITVADADDILGVDWAVGATTTKDRAVMMANVWMTGQKLPSLDPMPQEWKQAACEIAQEAVKGKMYGAKETGVVSKSVSAGDVSSSKTFTVSAKAYTAGESLALALLAPWLRGMGNVMMLKRL